jgi:hypothetical protein
MPGAYPAKVWCDTNPRGGPTNDYVLAAGDLIVVDRTIN